MIPKRQLDADVQAERAAFQRTLAQLDPACIKVVDESRIEVGKRLTYGYSVKGTRCYDVAEHRSGIVRSLIGWLGVDGAGVVVTHEGTVRGWTFRGFVRQALVPHLKKGDVVIWDNARIHGVEGVRELIEACGARVLALPRYSPDLSPIETGYLMRYPTWSKIKAHVKRLRAETGEALEAALEHSVAAVQAQDAAGWFRHCGYRHQPN